MKPRPSSDTPAGRTPAKPGAIVKTLRIERGWTLAEVSRRTGYPVSSLSKIENDRVSLSYDKLLRLSAAFEVDISRLFGAHASADGASSGRRSITRAGEGKSIASKNYAHIYPAAELLNKRLIPIVVENRARSLEEFGELVRHSGEEYVYVLEGELDVYTSIYAPVRLRIGDSIYLDSTMGHAYVTASDAPCRVLAVCSGNESQMIAAIGGALASQRPDTPSRPARPMARARATRRPRRK
jgi:transcriptional regulator with XRE-family HTH domain